MPTMMTSRPMTTCGVMRNAGRVSESMSAHLLPRAPAAHQDHHAAGNDEQRPRLMERHHAVIVEQKQPAEKDEPQAAARSVLAGRQEMSEPRDDEQQRPEPAHRPPGPAAQSIAEEHQP